VLELHSSFVDMRLLPGPMVQGCAVPCCVHVCCRVCGLRCMACLWVQQWQRQQQAVAAAALSRRSSSSEGGIRCCQAPSGAIRC
jgi:hypothetical protein